MPSRKIPTIKSLREVLSYDEDTGALSWKDGCGRGRGGSLAGCKVAEGYVVVSVFGCRVSAHRVAWALRFGKWPKGVLDHINGDRSDNRIANLRDVSRAENNRNRKMTAANTTGNFGIKWSATRGKWGAQISENGAVVHLGFYDSYKSAWAARRAAEMRNGYHHNHGRVVERKNHKAGDGA